MISAVHFLFHYLNFRAQGLARSLTALLLSSISASAMTTTSFFIDKTDAGEESLPAAADAVVTVRLARCFLRIP